MLYAHSAREQTPPQSYQEHAEYVYEMAVSMASQIAAFNATDGDTLIDCVKAASAYHDLGKLEQQNQRVLSGEVHAKSLPVNHVDAGTAQCLRDSSKGASFSALAVMAHHKGYPSFPAEMLKRAKVFRDVSIADKTDSHLQEMIRLHESSSAPMPAFADHTPKGNVEVFLRLMLSCLVDADHTDTARHYHHQATDERTLPLRAKQRLKQLDQWAAGFRTDHMSDRNRLRSEMYKACRDDSIAEQIVTCDSPVGSGKTTAVMANLLAQADKRGLRRIFVILPFMNIIQQSVTVYRKLLTLPGEKPEEVVTELHHRAQFESEELRHMAACWRAPIIVTTAVAFFEAFAANTPKALRRLHELPGSAIFVDEAHAALPASLLPISWKWINCFAREWGCYWVLASGSLCRFWEIDKIRADEQAVHVPQIVDDSLRNALMEYEHKRVDYFHDLHPRSSRELADWIQTFKGPRIIIMNTVQSAAVLAKTIEQIYGRSHVEHMSTALIAKHRNATLERVKQRLQNPSDDDWTLVATSCVEAGVDISFRIGFREVGSLSSLLQAAGRVNREGKYQNAQMWSFTISEKDGLITNPGLQGSATVLSGYLRQGLPIQPDLTTQSISDEIALYGLHGTYRQLLEKEKCRDFPAVESLYRVIDSDSCLTVIDPEIRERVENGSAGWRQLQQNAVQVSRKKLEALNVPQINDEIFLWDRGYDDFIGYMAGLL